MGSQIDWQTGSQKKEVYWTYTPTEKLFKSLKGRMKDKEKAKKEQMDINTI